MASKQQKAKKRQPPVKIPLTFDTAVGGLVQVKPSAVKKSATKKRGKK